MARDLDSFFGHSDSGLMIQTSWFPALDKMDMIDHISVLERLVSLRQVPGHRWSFWHDLNSQLGGIDADIEIYAGTIHTDPTFIYF